MFANLSRALGGGGSAAAASASGSATFADAAPSWEELASALATARAAAGLPAGPPDYVNGPTSPLASVRLFGTTGEPRVLLYRDHAAWCPYCEKVWMQLEEKRIPYRIEKINMRCYGDKPPSFLAKVPSGLLPAVELDGKLYTESAVIAQLLEEAFPTHTPLLPAAGSAERSAADALFRLERQLFSRWLGWLTRAGGDAAGRAGLEEALRAVEAALLARGGPYFLGSQLSLVDIVFAPFLERIAASILYYKGLRIRASGLYPALDAWFAAMMTRPVFAAIQSDFYTHAHDLPPQLGGCEFNADGPAAAAAIDGTDGVSWRLPLPPLSGASLEAYEAGEAPEKDRLEAAARLVGNAAAVVRFAARGCGSPGTRPVSAPLADPSARAGEAYIEDVDAALRRCAHALIAGTDAAAAAVAAGGAAGAPARKSAPAVRMCCGATMQLCLLRMGPCALTPSAVLCLSRVHSSSSSSSSGCCCCVPA
jgi:glutathione S-transferase